MLAFVFINGPGAWPSNRGLACLICLSTIASKSNSVSLVVPVCVYILYFSGWMLTPWQRQFKSPRAAWTCRSINKVVTIITFQRGPAKGTRRVPVTPPRHTMAATNGPRGTGTMVRTLASSCVCLLFFAYHCLAGGDNKREWSSSHSGRHTGQWDNNKKRCID